ncbi:MAG TPA: hypothetical protein ENN40_08850 [Candidatus Aminicenantes bacterium]|nr:hypothetical protein [Candidatus Aminicenantes bacterium]
MRRLSLLDAPVEAIVNTVDSTDIFAYPLARAVCLQEVMLREMDAKKAAGLQAILFSRVQHNP